MGLASYLLATLGLALLMVVHESGHYFAARRFGMRVTHFSIGFGPTLWKHQPPGSPTTFQVGLIPILAYVRIVGMNPYEANDPKDKASYANASLWARVVTIAAGPLANYFFATILFFIGLLAAGHADSDPASMRVDVRRDGPAQVAGMEDGDKILAVNGALVGSWAELISTMAKFPDQTVDIEVERNGAVIHKFPHVAPLGGEDGGKIQVGPHEVRVRVTVRQAALESLVEPALVVDRTLRGLVDIIVRKEKPHFSSTIGIMQQTAAYMRRSLGEGCEFLGGLSAYLGAFNLLPIPALDGGRLLFLGFEAASRRKPNAKMEAQVHLVGFLMMLTLIAVISYSELAQILKH